jgi:predicted ATPase/DNA-binding SARP family transcriptional activator
VLPSTHADAVAARRWREPLKIGLGVLAVDEFRILGPVEVLVGGRAVRLGGPKQRALLAKLLLARGAVVSRDQLVDAVWADEPPGAAAAALQVYVHGLRRALGAQRIERHGSGYRARLAAGELDLDRFEGLVARAERALAAGDADDAAADLQAALELWRGPALADLADEPLAAAEASPLEDSRQRALELRNDARLALGEHGALVGELERLIVEEPYRERLREQYVLALYRSGRQKEALEAYHVARRMLADELGVEPGSGLRELERAILRQDASLAPPEPRRPAKMLLPAPATPLIGRRLEVAAVAALLRSGEVRLVTLTGPGGTGKTRLAIAAAEELSTQLRDGAAFVDLSPVRAPALLVPTIAQTLGVPEGGVPLADALAEHLRELRILLVLDNLEQLLDGVTTISALLAAAPRLLVLATSREPLRLYGEHRYVVPSLAAPNQDDARDVGMLAANDAVRLFLARARAVDAEFTLTDENGPPVAEICRRLDGLPLAIELAAARADVLPPVAMARELGTSLDLLTEGARDLPPRQQTLRATIDWSHELLAEPEQAFFAPLGVFAAGWTLAAAAAVCDASPDTSQAILASLIAKNLVRSEGDWHGEQRYAMLETIRGYSRERLRASGASDEHARRHADFFLEFAEEVDTTVRAGGVDPVPLLDRIEREHDNLRAALDHLHGQEDVSRELRLASALQYYWVVRGHHSEGRARLEQALSRERPGDPRLLAKVLASAGRIAYRQGDFEQARHRYTESLAAAREAADDSAIGQALSDLGGIAREADDHSRAEQLYADGADALRRAGNIVRLGTVLNNSAVLCLERDEIARARELAEEALALQDESGDKEGRIFTVFTLGRIALGEGRLDEAARRLHESLTLAREVGYRDVSAYCLLAIAELMLRRGDANLAARLGGAADAILESIGITRQSDDEAARDGLQTGVEQALGADSARAAWEDGRTAPPDLADDALDALARGQ